MSLFGIKDKKGNTLADSETILKENVLNIKFEDQESLPQRLRNTLIASNIHTIRDILTYTPKQLLLLPNMGTASFSRLLSFLECYGIVLGEFRSKGTQPLPKGLPPTPKHKISQDILDMRFDEQRELPSRIINALRKENIHTISDIMPYTKQWLSLLPNIGTNSLDCLLKFLEEHGVFIGLPYESCPSDTPKNPPIHDISVREFIINNYDEKTSNIIIGRYEGRTLEDLGNEYNVSRQRILQICEKIEWKKIKIYFKEDRHKELFEKYNWDVESFCHVTKEPRFTYGYLQNRYSKGILPLDEFFPVTSSTPVVENEQVRPQDTIISTGYCGNLKYERILRDGAEYLRITRYKRKNHKRRKFYR